MIQIGECYRFYGNVLAKVCARETVGNTQYFRVLPYSLHFRKAVERDGRLVFVGTLYVSTEKPVFVPIRCRSYKPAVPQYTKEDIKSVITSYLTNKNPPRRSAYDDTTKTVASTIANTVALIRVSEELEAHIRKMKVRKFDDTKDTPCMLSRWLHVRFDNEIERTSL